jgi:hypothetical protein
VPGLVVKVEPNLAVPEIVGSETTVSGWFVVAVACDQTDTVPKLLVLVVLTVMNLPASAEVCVYVLVVAPDISEH